MDNFRNFPCDSNSFSTELIAMVTSSSAREWKEIAFMNDDERSCYGSLESKHDAYEAAIYVHKDGREAQIEFNYDESIYIDCREIHWSANLQDDVVTNAWKIATGPD